MHVHVHQNDLMRTTIELTDDQRSELMRIAAKRGHKGFSGIVQEAVDAYLRQQGEREGAIRTALSLEGTFKGRPAEEFEERVKSIRASWR